MKKKGKIIAILATILVLVLIIVVFSFYKTMNTARVENHSFYQYFAGRKVEYEGNLSLERKSGNITKVTTDNSQVMLDSTPMYYKDIQNQLFLPQNMAMVYPLQNGLMYKVNFFSNLQVLDESVYLQKSNLYKRLENGFLFDGDDLYLFIEPITLNIGEDIYELDALSYVISHYNGTVEIYQRGKDEYKILEGNYKNVIAKTSDYKINLSIDAIQYEEKEQLLMKKVDNLKNIE